MYGEGKKCSEKDGTIIFVMFCSGFPTRDLADLHPDKLLSEPTTTSALLVCFLSI